MNWFRFGTDMAFSVLFALIASGTIPEDKYRAFRKLALRIVSAMPVTDMENFLGEVAEARNDPPRSARKVG